MFKYICMYACMYMYTYSYIYLAEAVMHHYSNTPT